MNWFQRLFQRAPTPAKSAPPHPLVVPFLGDDIKVVVTQSDAVDLRRFLNSAAGSAIKSQLSACIAQRDALAVDQGTPYECGVARGWRECSALLISLSRPPTEQKPEQPEFVVAGDEDALEPNSP